MEPMLSMRTAVVLLALPVDDYFTTGLPGLAQLALLLIAARG